MHKLLSFSSKNSTPCKRKDSCSECNYDSLISQHKFSISTEHYLFSMLIPNFMAELNLMWIHTKLGKLHLHGIRYRHFQDVTTSVPLRESDNMLLFCILLTKELKISHCLTTKLDMFKAAPLAFSILSVSQCTADTDIYINQLSTLDLNRLPEVIKM